MKPSFTALCILLLCTITAAAQDQEYDFLKGSTLISMKGTVNTYEVDFFGTKYDFIVTVKENSAEKGLVFDYKMTNDKNTSGTVTMSDEARKTALAQNNYFSGGPMNLTDQTTVWVSNKVFDDLDKKGEAKISTDGGASWVVLKRKYYNYDFPVLTKSGLKPEFGYMYCESDDGNAKYWIQTGGNPIILKMDLGWSITYKEFKMANDE